jgi:hypothetical protein
MGNKQTAVEWFIEQLKNQGVQYIKMSKQAKEMEKQQIIDAYDQGDIQLVNGEQYYNETYGGNNE